MDGWRTGVGDGRGGRGARTMPRKRRSGESGGELRGPDGLGYGGLGVTRSRNQEAVSHARGILAQDVRS